jgi:hypothetical protein
MRLSDVMKFQKALALAAGASNEFEAAAAEQAARRLVAARRLDPTRIPNGSFDSDANFADNALLKKLREEWREQHPKLAKRRVAKPVNTKPKPKPAPAAASPTIPFNIDGPFNTKPKATAEPDTKSNKPRSDRNRDRHSPGYMREYMREYMRKRRAKRR